MRPTLCCFAGEFHTELERLDPALLPVGQGEGNIYISYPVHLEQYLMEGSYNKVFLLKENVPADTYKFFVEKLLLTLREEIAGPCRDVTLCLASRASLFFRWAAYSTPIYLAGDDFKHGSIS